MNGIIVHDAVPPLPWPLSFLLSFGVFPPHWYCLGLPGEPGTFVHSEVTLDEILLAEVARALKAEGTTPMCLDWLLGL